MGRPLAVITGASAGLGELFARRLASSHNLMLIARRRERLEALATELTLEHGCAVDILEADLAESQQLQRVCQAVAARSDLAILINNAGFGLRGPVWRADIEQLNRMQLLHINALMCLTHAALGPMRQRNAGGIINVASVAGMVARAGSAAYGASKSWVIAFTQSLYLDLRRDRSAVVVQALCPGFTYTDFHATMGMDRSQIAAPSYWLPAATVVDASLRGLAGRQLMVVPGWRYKLIAALVPRIPLRLRMALTNTAAKRIN